MCPSVAFIPFCFLAYLFDISSFHPLSFVVWYQLLSCFCFMWHHGVANHDRAAGRRSSEFRASRSPRWWRHLLCARNLRRHFFSLTAPPLNSSMRRSFTSWAPSCSALTCSPSAHLWGIKTPNYRAQKTMMEGWQLAVAFPKFVWMCYSQNSSKHLSFRCAWFYLFQSSWWLIC